MCDVKGVGHSDKTRKKKEKITIQFCFSPELSRLF